MSKCRETGAFALYMVLSLIKELIFYKCVRPQVRHMPHLPSVLSYIRHLYSFYILPHTTSTQSVNKNILVATFLGSCRRVCITAAGTMISPQQIAAIGVSTGNIFSKRGSIRPMEAKISLIPIKCINVAGKPATPVWPLAINCCSE